MQYFWAALLLCCGGGQPDAVLCCVVFFIFGLMRRRLLLFNAASFLRSSPTQIKQKNEDGSYLFVYLLCILWQTCGRVQQELSLLLLLHYRFIVFFKSVLVGAFVCAYLCSRVCACVCVCVYTVSSYLSLNVALLLHLYPYFLYVYLAVPDGGRRFVSFRERIYNLNNKTAFKGF